MRSRSPIIAFLVASPFEVLDLAGPASVFIYSMVKDKPYYSLRILSTTSGDTVKSMGGLSIGPTCRFSEHADPIDTLIVVGGLGSVEHQSPELLQWLRDRAPRIRRVASVCTGAFILAASGLLDGRRVATHWRHCDLFASRFEHLRVERDPIFIKRYVPAATKMTSTAVRDVESPGTVIECNKYSILLRQESPHRIIVGGEV